MRILVTHPGRHGDVLWSLPAIRALFEATHAQIDVATSPKYAGLVALIAAQPYVHHAFAIPDWAIEESAPITPREPPGLDASDYDQVYHLGYKGWPLQPLPYEAFGLLLEQTAHLQGLTLDLQRPWITVPLTGELDLSVVYGWSDEHFELKYGVTELVKYRLLTERGHVIHPLESRWAHEAPPFTPEGWGTSAQWIARTRVFLGCCSALHVLACALGIPCVIMEPAEARWNPIFWPFGKVGPQVTLVLGNDGQPTFDARAVAHEIRRALAGGA